MNRKIVVIAELDGWRKVPVELTPREYARIEQAAPPGCSVAEFMADVISNEVARWSGTVIDFPHSSRSK